MATATADEQVHMVALGDDRGIPSVGVYPKERYSSRM
jgi:hypothetical protein